MFLCRADRQNLQVGPQSTYILIRDLVSTLYPGSCKPCIRDLVNPVSGILSTLYPGSCQPCIRDLVNPWIRELDGKTLIQDPGLAREQD